jgi:opacity protein-like surface antigen
LRIVLAAAVAILLAAAASAQDVPAADIGLGYAYLRDDDIDENFTAGWVASLNLNLGPAFALVGEVGGNYKTLDEFDDRLKLSVHSFMGGFRLMSRGSDSIHPYLQLLAGGVRAKVSADVGVDVSDARTHFAFQPGIGIDFRLSDNIFLRVGGDFRRIRGDEDEDEADTNEYRAHVGLSFGLGGR